LTKKWDALPSGLVDFQGSITLYLTMYLSRSPVKDTSNEIDWL